MDIFFVQVKKYIRKDCFITSTRKVWVASGQNPKLWCVALYGRAKARVEETREVYFPKTPAYDSSLKCLRRLTELLWTFGCA